MEAFCHRKKLHNVFYVQISAFFLSVTLLKNGVTPTKLFDYIEAGIPIVAALPLGASRRIIEDHQIGLLFHPDISCLAELLKRMVEDENLRRECRENMKQERSFSEDKQIEKWFGMLYTLGLP